MKIFGAYTSSLEETVVRLEDALKDTRAALRERDAQLQQAGDAFSERVNQLEKMYAEEGARIVVEEVEKERKKGLALAGFWKAESRAQRIENGHLRRNLEATQSFLAEAQEDVKRLDYLQQLTMERRYTGRVVLRLSRTGRGWRLHETSRRFSEGGRFLVRNAIDRAMKDGPRVT